MWKKQHTNRSSGVVRYAVVILVVLICQKAIAPFLTNTDIVSPSTVLEHGRDVSSPSEWSTGTIQQHKLAVVVPFPAKQDEIVKNAIENWQPGCKTPCATSQCSVDLVLYVSCCPTTCGTLSSLDYVTSDAFQKQRTCFNKVDIVHACLQEDEEGFPKGVNNMFYKALYPPDSGFAVKYDDIFWMEHDVTPVQKYWIDALQREVQEPYMIKGSVYVGDAKHEEVTLEASKMLWLVHINGNALYNMKSSCLQDIIKRAQHDRLNAFDIELQRQLYGWAVESNLESYKLFQHCIHLYQYTEMIFNCVDGSCVHPLSERTFFVHGNAHSTAGNYTKASPE